MGGGRDAIVGADSDSMEDTDSGKSWSICNESVVERSISDSEFVHASEHYGQVRGEMEPQKTIITGEGCKKATEILLMKEDGTQLSALGGGVDSRTVKAKDEEPDPEFRFGGNNSKSADGESQVSNASVNHHCNNCVENEFGDCALKGLEFPWRLEGNAIEKRRRAEMHRKIIQKRSMWRMRSGKIEDEKERLLRYTPGVWLVESGGMNKCNYEIPTVTTLLLVGPKGAGKSTLINNILRVLGSGNEILGSAQVSYKSSGESGTYFLHEYTPPGASKAFCIFDSRGLSQSVAKDFPVLKSWMLNGIRHGELVLRPSDDHSLRMSMKHKARDGHCKVSKIRKVNYVIFVVSALSIFQIMDNGDIQASDTLVKLFNCPYISFKDDKPVVVMTHGDELDNADRIKAHIFLGELLGVSAADQVYDISEDHNPVVDLALLDMLEFSLQRADRNLPYKESDVSQLFALMVKVLNTGAQWFLNTINRDGVRLIVVFLAFAILVCLEESKHKKEHKIEWHKIRHLWYG